MIVKFAPTDRHTLLLANTYIHMYILLYTYIHTYYYIHRCIQTYNDMQVEMIHVLLNFYRKLITVKCDHGHTHTSNTNNYTNIYSHTNTLIHIFTFIFKHIQKYIHTHIYTHTYIYIKTYIHSYTCSWIFINLLQPLHLLKINLKITTSHHCKDIKLFPIGDYIINLTKTKNLCKMLFTQKFNTKTE